MFLLRYIWTVLWIARQNRKAWFPCFFYTSPLAAVVGSVSCFPWFNETICEIVEKIFDVHQFTIQKNLWTQKNATPCGNFQKNNQNFTCQRHHWWFTPQTFQVHCSTQAVIFDKRLWKAILIVPWTQGAFYLEEFFLQIVNYSTKGSNMKMETLQAKSKMSKVMQRWNSTNWWFLTPSSKTFTFILKKVLLPSS